MVSHIFDGFGLFCSLLNSITPSVYYFIDSLFSCTHDVAGDVGALGWWDLFINFGYD